MNKYLRKKEKRSLQKFKQEAWETKSKEEEIREIFKED